MLDYKNIIIKRYALSMSGSEIARQLSVSKSGINDFLRDKLCKEFPEVIRLKSWTEVSKTYVLPKNLVRIGKPRTLSESQLRHLQELQNKV